ncbi:MAG: hypothetical protein Crog4KO_07410 [Crocinitomicaceae bacterium]
MKVINTILLTALGVFLWSFAYGKDVIIIVKDDPTLLFIQDEPIVDHQLKCRVQYDQDSVFFEALKNQAISLDESLCNGHITLEIQGFMIQDYYNEYRCDQLSNLDTIYVQERRTCKMYFPRLLNNVGTNFDFNHTFVTHWLEDESFQLDAIYFEVKHADSLSRKDKRRIKQNIRAYCNTIGTPQFAKDVVFSNSPYVARNTDEFSEGTAFTRSFIDEQNTPEMRLRAEKYALVILVLPKDE